MGTYNCKQYLFFLKSVGWCRLTTNEVINFGDVFFMAASSMNISGIMKQHRKHECQHFSCIQVSRGYELVRLLQNIHNVARSMIS